MCGGGGADKEMGSDRDQIILGYTARSRSPKKSNAV